MISKFNILFNALELYKFKSDAIRDASLKGSSKVVDAYIFGRARNAPQGIKRDPIVEDYLLKYQKDNPSTLLRYVRDVIKKPWPEVEDIFLNYPKYALSYVAGTKEVFPRAEEIFAKDANVALSYAMYTEKPFKLGEPVIAKDSELSYIYAKRVLKGRFQLGEEAIAKDPADSYAYAVEVLKGRFKAGEEGMRKYPRLWQRYEEFINQALK